MSKDYENPLVATKEIADAHRYDAEDEGAYIHTLILGSQALLYNAGAWDSKNPLTKVAIQLIVGHWLENRDLMGYDYKSVENLPIGIKSIVNSLRFWGDDSDG